MNNQFSIYEPVLSEEAVKLRRNSLLSAILCLFIGFTESLPQKFSLLGMSFNSPEKQEVVGYFILLLSSYMFLHFLTVAALEVAKWLHPLFRENKVKEELLKHPAFDETDFISGFPGLRPDEQDLNQVTKETRDSAHRTTFYSLRHLYVFIYLKLFIEIAVPLIMSVWGLFLLATLITK